MVEAVTFLTYLAFVLLVGVVCAILANILRIPKILFLLFAGIALQYLKLPGQKTLEFPIEFLTIIAVFTLAIVVFEGGSQFKFHDFDQLTTKVLKLFFLSLLFNVIVVAPFAYFITGVRSLPLSILFAVLIAATAAEIVLVLIKNGTSKAAKVLQIESLLNDPFVVLIPFIIISFLTSKQTFYLIEQVGPFLNQIITGLGAGLLIGLIVPKIYSERFIDRFKHIAELSLIVVAVGTYVLAENLGGNGALAVTVAALMFGNFGVNLNILNFSSIFSEALQILIFVLTGLVIKIPFNGYFIFTVFVLYIVYSLARFAASMITFKDFTFKEQIFTTLVAPKGVMVAVLVLALSTLAIPGLDVILNYTLAMLLLSIIISTIAIKFYHEPAPSVLINDNVKKKKA